MTKKWKRVLLGETVVEVLKETLPPLSERVKRIQIAFDERNGLLGKTVSWEEAQQIIRDGMEMAESQGTNIAFDPEALEIFEEFHGLTSPAFASLPDVRRQTLYNLLQMFEAYLYAKFEQDSAELSKVRGGWSSGDERKKEASTKYEKIVNMYFERLKAGESKKAARISVAERHGVSESTIYRALSLLKKR